MQRVACVRGQSLAEADAKTARKLGLQCAVSVVYLLQGLEGERLELHTSGALRCSPMCVPALVHVPTGARPRARSCIH